MKISVCEGEQRLQYHLLGQGAIGVSCGRRAVEGEQQTSSDHQPVGEDVRGLVEGLGNAADVVVQQPAVELRAGGGAKRVNAQKRCVVLPAAASHHDLQRAVVEAGASLRAVRHHRQLVHLVLKTAVKTARPKLTFELYRKRLDSP